MRPPWNENEAQSWVAFHQNIGIFVARFTSTDAGNYCRGCATRTFLTSTTITAAVGWFGVVSLFLAPIFVAHNVGHFAAALLKLRGAPPGACPPTLTPEVVERLRPYAEALDEGLAAGGHPVELARAAAQEAGVTPGQVLLFLRGQV